MNSFVSKTVNCAVALLRIVAGRTGPLAAAVACLLALHSYLAQANSFSPREIGRPLSQAMLVKIAADASCHVPAGAERRDVLDAMRGAVERDLRQPVKFVVHAIRVCGQWAFVVAEPQQPGGKAINWQSTICSGDVSHLVGALSQMGSTGSWTLTDYALCPTDVAWENWPEKYGAPQALFGE